MWVYVGPGRSRELPECSSLFGDGAEYEILAHEGCGAQAGAGGGTGNSFGVCDGLPTCPDHSWAVAAPLKKFEGLCPPIWVVLCVPLSQLRIISRKGWNLPS